MENKLQGEVTLTFVRGGIAKSGKGYLQCSNGRSDFFVNIPKEISPEELDDALSGYTEDDQITLEVSVLVGTDSVKLVRVVE